MQKLMALLVLAAMLAAGGFGLFRRESGTESSIVPALPAAPAEGVLAISFVQARPGQRERLERYLRQNWLALDELALQQRRIRSYRLLRADPEPREDSWDFAVVIEYANRAAMADFVPFYLELARERPHRRIDGLDFADLGKVVQQKVVTAVPNEGQDHE